MTTQLTQRDKKLLVLLAYFLLIVAVGWFVLKPLGDRVAEVNTEIAAAKLEQLDLKQKILSLDATRQQLGEYNELLKEEGKNFYPRMTNEEVDRMLTTMILSHGLSAVDMTIAEGTEYGTLSPYAASALYTKQTAEKDSGASGEDANALDGIYITQVQILTSGARENLQALLDSLFNDYSGIRVTAFGWSEQKQGEALYLAAELELYMMEK